MTPDDLTLTIVIPALNEEASIGETIERTLRAADVIRQRTAIDTVNVVVVSDGSTDRTAEIARGYAGIELVVFPENRGYGAAIKAGWEHAPAGLLAFLDADGTCDPLFFVPMCGGIIDQGYDVVLGMRMGADSRMPAIRRLGNLLFALLLGYLSKKTVRDSASGMRVLRRRALDHLLPLPDGLHFTPAMSARALMDDEVTILELGMPYAERQGRSKLHVLRDGLRFLEVILSAAAYIRVSRITLPIMAALGAACALLALGPTAFYLRQHRLEEWMFYRLALVGMLGTMLVITFCATVVSEHICALTLLRYEHFSAHTRGLWRYQTLKRVVAIAGLLAGGAALLNGPGVVELLRTGHVTLHWSRVMAGAFVGINFTLTLAMLCTLKIVRALNQRQPFVKAGRNRPEPA